MSPVSYSSARSGSGSHRSGWAGSRAPMRSASNWAAKASPPKSAIPVRLAQSSSAIMPVSAP